MKRLKYGLFLLALPLLMGFSNIAHRGDNQDNRIAEHSFAADDAALAYSADYLELDVHESADGQLVVSHDTNLKRVFHANMNIVDHSLSTLRTARNSAGEPIRTVAEMFERYAGDPNIKFMIETKLVGNRERDLEQKVVNVVNQYGLGSRMLFESFSLTSLAKLRALAPNIPTTYLQGSNDNYTQVGPNQYYASNIYSHNVADYLAQHGKKYLVWGIDDQAQQRTLVNAFNLAGIFTNYPERLSAVLGKTASVHRINGQITIKYRGNYSVVVWNNYGIGAGPSGMMLKNGTKAAVSEIVAANGRLWYGLGNNRWLDGNYVATGDNVTSQQLSQINKVATVSYIVNGRGYKINLWRNANGTGATGRQLATGTRWKIVGQQQVGNRLFYQLGTNQWIDSQYAIVR